MEHEVIVVGAGPGGSTTAMALACQGRDVLLIDRHAFPRDKACGDAVPASALDQLFSYGMKERFEEQGFYPVNRLLISAQRGGVLEADLHRSPRGTDSYVVPRLQFDAVLQAHAQACGARFLQATVKEPLFEDGRVVGVVARENGHVHEIRSQIVVGADGATSAVMRALRPEPERHQDSHRAVALRAYIEGLDELPHEVEFYLYKGILPGYAWIFPIGEGQANIGLGMRIDKFRRLGVKLEGLLDRFLDMPGIKKRLRSGWKLQNVATWPLSFGSQKGLRHAFDGALLVGDAAGFINPLTGGGIHNAITSGRLAAQTILEALGRSDTSAASLRVYETRCHDAMWRDMRRSLFFQRLLGALPGVADILVNRASANSRFAEAFLSKL